MVFSITHCCVNFIKATTTDGQLIYDAIQRRLKASNVGPDAKRDKLMSEFSIIRTSARLNEVDAKLGKTPLKFYTEFLKKRQLDEARKKRAIDVFEIINRTKLIPIPPKLDGWYHLYQNTPETIYASNTSIEAFLNLDYAQFIAVKDFLHPEAQYSTEHGVKGEEYDNVIFVISKGWNQYQFETYAPMITKKAVIPSGKQASFERNRNLFYVCCSRPKKRLIFFVTVPIDSTFKSFLVELVGEQNIFTFSQYIERKSIK